jgi:hypothetical protein
MKLAKTDRVVYATVPFCKSDIKVEFITALINADEYDLQVAVYVSGDGGIFRDLPAETYELTHSHLVAWVVRYYMQNVLPFADPHAADLAQIKTILQDHAGDGFPTRKLVEAGWVLGESTPIMQFSRTL